jgi:hypothetical protein
MARDGAIIFGDLFGKLDVPIRSPRDMTQWNRITDYPFTLLLQRRSVARQALAQLGSVTRG